MRHTMLINLVVLVDVFLITRAIDQDLDVITNPFERIPLHHALKTLGEVVQEEKTIQEFCRSNYRLEKDCKEKKYDYEDDGECDGKPTNCADLFNAGKTTSGVYSIYVKADSCSEMKIKVYCDMVSEEGGWTVIQRREQKPPQLNFTRNWQDYLHGFGNLSGEFWLGNENIHKLTNQDNVTLRIELGDFAGNYRFANYKNFQIGDHTEDYVLNFQNYSGNAGDSLVYHLRSTFVTVDHNDQNGCAQRFRGGWWYKNCLHANLNGEYNNTRDKEGVIWYHWLGQYYSLKRTEMKLRPETFDPTKKFKPCG